MNFFSSIDGPQVLQIMIHDCEAGNDVIFMVDILVNDEPARIKPLLKEERNPSALYSQRGSP